MEISNDTQVKIQAGISKKVGRPNYSSYDAALSITIVTNISAIADDRFGDLVGNIYDKVQQAVDARIEWECRNDKSPSMNATVAPHVMANTSSPAPAQAVVEPEPTVNVYNDFRDFLAAESSELGVSPEVIVNSIYRQLINGELLDWRQQGSALVQHWSGLGNAQASQVFAHAASELIPF